MKRALFIALGLSLALLSGCDGSSDFDDLQTYMEEVRARPKGTIEPLPAFIPYEAFTYSAAALRPHSSLRSSSIWQSGSGERMISGQTNRESNSFLKGSI